MQHQDMSEAELRRFIATSKWKFAVTMPETPHEYILRRETHDKAAFEKFVMHIRHHGYQQTFRGVSYTYLDVDGWQYWTMGAALEETILINRAQIGGLNEHSITSVLG